MRSPAQLKPPSKVLLCIDDDEEVDHAIHRAGLRMLVNAQADMALAQQIFA